jgi:hypothetical protein
LYCLGDHWNHCREKGEKMSKEIESLKRIETTFSMNKQGKESVYREYTNSIYPYYEDFDLVLKGLQRLEAIDNANPSEALEKLSKEIPQYDSWLKYIDTIKQALLKAQEHNSINLLMQELDCKDFAELRKYARCGYEKINNFKGSKEVKIEIPESGLMDYNPVKHYLKWEDLEFDELEFKVEQKKDFKVKLNGTEYGLEIDITFGIKEALIFDINANCLYAVFHERHKQFFNDLHLERVEE